MTSPWLLIAILGPLLFCLILGWSIWRNRRETGPGDEERSDRAATALREELDAEDKERDRQSPWT